MQYISHIIRVCAQHWVALPSMSHLLDKILCKLATVCRSCAVSEMCSKCIKCTFSWRGIASSYLHLKQLALAFAVRSTSVAH